MRKSKIIITAILLTLIACAGYFGYKTYVEKPEPIQVHAFYKRANWAWTENDVGLLEYGDDVLFQYKNVKYSLDSADFIAWQVYDRANHGTKSMSFKITMPDETIIQDTCYEPLTPKGQTNCVIIDTGTIRYYVHPDRVDFK